MSVFMWRDVCDAHATVCMWSSEKNFSESLFTFQHMDLEDQTQVIGLGDEPLPTEWFLPPKNRFLSHGSNSAVAFCFCFKTLE